MTATNADLTATRLTSHWQTLNDLENPDYKLLELWVYVISVGSQVKTQEEGKTHREFKETET